MKKDSIERMWIRRLLQGLCSIALLLLLWPSLVPVFRTRERISIDQVRGKGCLVRNHCELSRNPLAWQVTRAPELQCPLMAAKCLAGEKLDFSYRKETLAAIDEALQRLPETFDTGDGIILFGHEMRRARESIATGGRVIYDVFRP